MRVQTGGAITVTATELWQAEVRAGRAFVRGGTQPAVPAENPHVQLLNPAGSGVQVIVRSIKASSGVAQGLTLARYDTPLATLDGAGFNLLTGGAAAGAIIKRGSNAGALGTAYASFDIIAASLTELVPEWFAELSPGQGILVLGGTPNTQLSAMYFWREV